MKQIIVIACIAVAIPAFAQTDLTKRLPSTSIAATSTNTSAMQPSFGWQRGDKLAIQGTISGTNSVSGNLDLKIDTSLDTSYWSSSVHSVRLTAGVTGTVTTLLSITNTDGSRYLRISSMANTNAATGGTITINKIIVDAMQ